MGTAQRGRRSHPAALDGRRVQHPAITLREPEAARLALRHQSRGPEVQASWCWPRSSGNVEQVALQAVLRTNGSARPFFENSTAYR
jgi:hypothetical protein